MTQNVRNLRFALGAALVFACVGTAFASRASVSTFQGPHAVASSPVIVPPMPSGPGKLVA